VKDVTHFILWLFVGSLVVLVVTHATGFSTAVTAVGGQLTNDAYLLSGGASNVGSPAPGSWAKA
jgi:hypothetical protein